MEESNEQVIEWEVIKKRGGKSPRYKWPDRLAVKKKLSEKQKAFVDHYIKTRNATESYRASKWTLDKPELWTQWDNGNARITKNIQRVREYLQEKMAVEAEECLEIQMEMIRDEKMPPAVRHDAIKDRLNRLWVGREKEESSEYTGIWEVTITIKHKAPEVIEGVEILDSEEKEGKDGETI